MKWFFVLVCFTQSSYGETIATGDVLQTQTQKSGTVSEAANSAYELATKCATAASAPFRKRFKEMVVDPFQYLINADPAATQKFNEDCSKNPDCLGKLYEEAYDRSPNENDLKRFRQKPSDITVLVHNARARRNSNWMENKKLSEQVAASREDEKNHRWVQRDWDLQKNDFFWYNLAQTVQKAHLQQKTEPIMFTCDLFGKTLEAALEGSALKAIGGAGIAGQGATEAVADTLKDASKDAIKDGIKESLKTSGTALPDGWREASTGEKQLTSEFYQNYSAPSAEKIRRVQEIKPDCELVTVDGRCILKQKNFSN